jgi:hypothetical protein
MTGKCINGGASQDLDDRFELYVLSRLPASEVESMEEHFLICDYCRDRLDEVAAFALSARKALKEIPQQPSTSFWRNFSLLPRAGLWRLGIGIASAVAALMLTIGMYRVWQGGPLAPVAALQLTMIRTEEVPVTVPSRELDIDFLDAPDASKVVIVNAQRLIVWTGVGASIRIQTALPDGAYFARVYAGNGTLIHDYEFRIAR